MSTQRTRREAAAMIRRVLDHPGLVADTREALALVRRLEGAATALAESSKSDRELTRST